MIQNDTNFTSNYIHFFECKLCDFKSSKKGDYNRHLITSKHVKRYKRIQKDTNFTSNYIADIPNYTCECGNIYKYHSGLWKHKKICQLDKITNHNNSNDNSSNTGSKDDIIMMLIKQNSELIKEQTDIKQLMLELVKNGINNITNNNINNNSNNKSFNLNFFLNETCKNAMNINDFVDSIKLELNDLEKVGQLGYIEGISNIIIKNLNALGETERPLHCTDKKREIIYIKDQGQWEKEDENKSKLKKAINKIAHKNIKLITQFREKYPECKKLESPLSDKYNKMIIEAMGGNGDNNEEKSDKIIKNISKKIIIDKTNN